MTGLPATIAAASDTFRLTDARYRGGADTFLASLDSQRSLYSAQQSLTSIQLAAAVNRVALYRAIGGDDIRAEFADPRREPSVLKGVLQRRANLVQDGFGSSLGRPETMPNDDLETGQTRLGECRQVGQ